MTQQISLNRSQRQRASHNADPALSWRVLTRGGPVNSTVGLHNLMKLSLESILLLVLLTVSATAQSKSGGTGSICVAPPDRPTTGEKSLANPAGGNPISVYSIQVDKMPVVVASNDRAIRISSISPTRKHLVKIIGDGKTVQSFWFTFKEFKTKDLCLFFNSLYETWSLWDGKEGRATCKCQ